MICPVDESRQGRLFLRSLCLAEVLCPPGTPVDPIRRDGAMGRWGDGATGDGAVEPHEGGRVRHLLPATMPNRSGSHALNDSLCARVNRINGRIHNETGPLPGFEFPVGHGLPVRRFKSCDISCAGFNPFSV